VQEERDDWTLQDDIDMPIGLGNDEILDNEEDDFGKSDDSYLSVEEDVAYDYTWEEDASQEQQHDIWPLEMLHAPSSSRKRRCKRKAPCGQRSMTSVTSRSQMKKRVTVLIQVSSGRSYVRCSAVTKKP
jgi:hypothetical protein